MVRPTIATIFMRKWESLALAPADDLKAPNDYFLLVGSDNDFITQHGVMAGKAYADSSGEDVDTLVLAWRVTLPTGLMAPGHPKSASAPPSR